MKLEFLKRSVQQHLSTAVAFALFLGSFWQWNASADQVETQSGDKYTGKVLSINGETLVLQSEVLGTVRLPRAKISQITLGTNTPATAASATVSTDHVTRHLASTPTNSAGMLAVPLTQHGSDSNIIQQVRSQFLNGAGPEANNKFNELLGGYLSGNLDVNDIRKEALSAANQLRAARKDMGEGADSTLDSYL